MKSWKPALTILCCLFVVVSSYQPVKHGHKHHIKGTKKAVYSSKAGKPQHDEPAHPKKKESHEVKVPPTRRNPPRAAAAKQAATPSTCPACNPTPYNLTADQVVPKYASLVSSIWGQNIDLTQDAADFVSLIKTLAIDSDPLNVAMSIYTTFFINNFIPYLGQEPDACVIAEVINGSLSCSVDHNQTLLQSALTKLKDKFINDINPRLERTMALSAGCDSRCGEYPPDPKVNKSVCYENGFVYPIREIWAGASVSASLQTQVYNLYNSTDSTDRFLAACATFALLDAPRRAYNLWNVNYVAEGMDLVLSPSVKQDCCYPRTKRIEAIRKFYDADAISSIDSVKRSYSLSQCAPATPAPTKAP